MTARCGTRGVDDHALRLVGCWSLEFGISAAKPRCGCLARIRTLTKRSRISRATVTPRGNWEGEKLSSEACRRKGRFGSGASLPELEFVAFARDKHFQILAIFGQEILRRLRH